MDHRSERLNSCTAFSLFTDSFSQVLTQVSSSSNWANIFHHPVIYRSRWHQPAWSPRSSSSDRAELWRNKIHNKKRGQSDKVSSHNNFRLTRLYVSLSQFSARNVYLFARAVSPRHRVRTYVHVHARRGECMVACYEKVIFARFHLELSMLVVRGTSCSTNGTYVYTYVCTHAWAAAAQVRLYGGIDAHSFLHISAARYRYPWIPWATRRVCHVFNHKFRFPSRRGDRSILLDGPHLRLRDTGCPVTGGRARADSIRVEKKETRFFSFKAEFGNLDTTIERWANIVSLKITLTSCASNWFADHNEWPNRIDTIIRRFLFRLVGMMSLNRNYLSGSNKFIIWFAF